MTTYETLQDIYKHIFEQLKYAELKNGVLLTLQIGLLYFITRFIMIEYKVLFLLLLIFNISITLFSFFPNLNSFTFSNLKDKDTINNLFFFESIRHYTKYEYLKLFTQDNPSTQNTKILLDISEQIIVLSNITSKKHLLYKISFLTFCVFNFIAIFYIILFMI